MIRKLESESGQEITKNRSGEEPIGNLRFFDNIKFLS